MTTITVPLTDEQLAELESLARQTGASPADVAREGLAQWLEGRRKRLEEAADFVLEKNAELYRRLA